MATRPRQRSPLALVILSFVFEGPAHAYRMHELIKQRGKDSVVNVAQRNSVYQTIAQLEATGLIRVRETQQDGGRPERVIYEITPAGRTTFHAWLEGMLIEPRREFGEFPAALATVMALSPATVSAALEKRLHSLEQQLAESESSTRSAREAGLPRLFTLDDEYKQAIAKAEIDWLQRVLSELASGELSWNDAWLRKIARQFEAK